MLFDNSATNTKQGDIGEARAIYEYTKLNYTVSKPIADSAKYDMIVDDGTALHRVQVKTTRHKNLSGKDKIHKGYNVNLKTTGGNTLVNTIRPRGLDDYDLLFVLTEQSECWSIPVDALGIAEHSIVIGNTKYNEYRMV